MNSRRPELAHPPARILIVDDERQNRQLLELMLAPEGFSFLSADSGEEALALVTSQLPDLVLLDVMLPGMDGYEVARAIKDNLTTKNIPIIMVTAMDDRGTKMLGLSAGAEDFLSKPINRAELCVRVRNLLRLKAHGDYHDKYGQLLEGEVGSRTADLVESERMYRSTFDTAPVGIVQLDKDGGWLRVNRCLCELLDYTREELQNPAMLERIYPEHELATQADALRKLASGSSDQAVIDEMRYRRRDGSFVWTRVNLSVHRDSEGQAHRFIAIIEDITARRTLEAHVRQANKMEAVGLLASGVAHDFNNLLSVVLGYADLISADLKQGDPMRDDLAEIKGAGLRAADLTRQLLAFGRQQVLQPKVVDLSVVASGMEKMLRRVIGDDVELTAICPLDLGKVMVDPGQLEQVIMNLSVNARDAMPQGGKLTIETTEVMLDESHASAHESVKPGPHIMLSVSDTGTGIDKATQARMFEPFFTTKEPGKGTGLGLATVFGIVRQSGGAIWVDSETGRGTTFRICFPLADRNAVSLVSCPPDGGTLRGSETILLVEDDEHVRVLARVILHRYGYRVLEAQSGGDALLLCEQYAGTIDLLLTDVVMPRMSGRQLSERLKLIRPDIKVLYMSGYTDDAVVRHGILDATVAFVQKPLTMEALPRTVRETLDRGARSAVPSLVA